MTSAFDTAFLSRLRARLAMELDQSGNALLEGTLKNFEDYKQRVGKRQGLLRAIDIAAEVEKEMISPPERKKA